ncbi:HD domain-containing protein [Pseudonocardia xishanensis]|uniref:HD domain-containing protein n=1 Tax=Pseudonocardia xishanensis TaxID=630995 RepID=A0ABP8RZT5_9PSEU
MLLARTGRRQDPDAVEATAAAVAEAVLASALPRRWDHVRAVARRAADLAVGLPPDEVRTLVSAAWLHDVGYAPAVADTGFHPLDGARYVRALGFGDRIAALVAFHSAAAAKARVLGLADQLAEFTDEDTVVRDLLWYADMTIGPDGAPMDVESRLAEIRRRRADDPRAIAALDLGLPARWAAVARAEAWLRSRGPG